MTTQSIRASNCRTTTVGWWTSVRSRKQINSLWLRRSLCMSAANTAWCEECQYHTDKDDDHKTEKREGRAPFAHLAQTVVHANEYKSIPNNNHSMVAPLCDWRRVASWNAMADRFSLMFETTSIQKRSSFFISLSVFTTCVCECVRLWECVDVCLDTERWTKRIKTRHVALSVCMLLIYTRLVLYVLDDTRTKIVLLFHLLKSASRNIASLFGREILLKPVSFLFALSLPSTTSLFTFLALLFPKPLLSSHLVLKNIRFSFFRFAASGRSLLYFISSVIELNWVGWAPVTFPSLVKVLVERWNGWRLVVVKVRETNSLSHTTTSLYVH